MQMYVKQAQALDNLEFVLSDATKDRYGRTASGMGALLARRLTEQPPHPREKNPAISKPLDDVIYMSLARLPADRYQTMEALREEG